MDDIQVEQCALKYDGQRQKFEMNLLHEVERIQGEIDVVAQNTDTTNQISDSLKNEVSFIESAIADKKKQLEKLVNEMKEVNLQSLTVTSSEEIRNLFEGEFRGFRKGLRSSFKLYFVIFGYFSDFLGIIR